MFTLHFKALYHYQLKLFVLLFLLNAAGNKSSLFYIDQVANCIYFPNIQLDLLYLRYFFIYGLLKSSTQVRKILLNTGIY